jgi:hypothetical protein
MPHAGQARAQLAEEHNCRLAMTGKQALKGSAKLQRFTIQSLAPVGLACVRWAPRRPTPEQRRT